MRAKSIITKDEQFHYSIPEIAHEVGLNEVKLKKGFKQVFGVGLYGFLMTVRMEKAKNLLENTSKPVNEISILVGYKSTSSFIKLYKKRYGCSPYAWRRLQKKKYEV
jgi:AraC-like DNA-binding protein